MNLGLKPGHTIENIGDDYLVLKDEEGQAIFSFSSWPSKRRLADAYSRIDGPICELDEDCSIVELIARDME